MKAFLLAAVLAPVLQAGLIFDLDLSTTRSINDGGLGFPPITLIGHYTNTGPNDLARDVTCGTCGFFVFGFPTSASFDMRLDLIPAMSTIDRVAGGFTIDRERATSGTYSVVFRQRYEDVATHELFTLERTRSLDVVQTPEVNTFWTAMGALVASLAISFWWRRV